MHRSYGLQGSLKRRYKHPSPTSINGYHAAKKLLSQSPAKRPTFAFADESGYTFAFAQRIAHKRLHGETGAVLDGGAITTLGAFRTFANLPGSGVRTANFAAFGAQSDALLKNAESHRDSDALMRVAVPRRRSPAGLRDLFRFCRNLWLYAPHSGLSMRARWGWYHYPRHALRTAEGLGARLSKRLICRFLRSDGCRSLYGIFSDISARKIRLLTLPSYYGMIKFTNTNLRIMRRASLHRSPQKLFQRMHLPPFQGGYRRHRHKSNRFYIPPPRLLRYF